MKNYFNVLICFCFFATQAQDSLTVADLHSQIFSLSPISKKVDKVNGLVLGVGHYDSGKKPMQVVNGANVEASPLGLVLPLVPFAVLDPKYILRLTGGFSSDTAATYIKIRGLNISSGGFFEGGEVSGLNISVFTRMNAMHGVSISPGVTASYQMSGLSIAAMYNTSVKMSGMAIGFVNSSEIVKGIQLGCLNFSSTAKGAQIGLYNKKSTDGRAMQIGLVNDSGSRRGFQLGFWNTNSKRALPFINW